MTDNKPETPDRARARARQLLRRSSAASPIPAAQYKTPRSQAKQGLREELRETEQSQYRVRTDMNTSDPDIITETDIDVVGEILEADEAAVHQRIEANDDWAERYATHLWSTR